MRALSNLANFSLIIITFSLIALGASLVAIPQLLEENGKLQALVSIQGETINDLEQQIINLRNTLIKHAELIKQLYTERNAALAKINELSVEVYILRVHIASMTIAQKAAPFLPILSLGWLFAAKRSKKERRQSKNADAPNDENVVTVHMSREQVKEYSKWRRNGKK
jgi:hypothetical protein